MILSFLIHRTHWTSIHQDPFWMMPIIDRENTTLQGQPAESNHPWGNLHLQDAKPWANRRGTSRNGQEEGSN